MGEGQGGGLLILSPQGNSPVWGRVRLGNGVPKAPKGCEGSERQDTTDDSEGAGCCVRRTFGTSEVISNPSRPSYVLLKRTQQRSRILARTVDLPAIGRDVADAGRGGQLLLVERFDLFHDLLGGAAGGNVVGGGGGAWRFCSVWSMRSATSCGMCSRSR